MDTRILFRSHDILVTPAMARFGPVTYQMDGVTSVAVYHHPKLNPMAVTLVLIAIGLAAFAYVGRQDYPNESLWSAIAAPVALIIGLAWQRIRPVLEYRLVMKTAGHETETVTTFDRAQVFELRQAIENAFHMPRVPGEQVGAIRMEPPEPQDQPANEGLHITRDWVVANADLAPR